MCGKRLMEVHAQNGLADDADERGRTEYCLGISIMQDDDNNCVWLHQNQYILNMLSRYGMTEAKVASTPADVNVKLVKTDGVSKEIDPINGWKSALFGYGYMS